MIAAWLANNGLTVRPVPVAYLLVMSIFCTLFAVRVENGFLNMSAIATQSAGILLNPVEALFPAMAVAVARAGRRQAHAPRSQLISVTLWTVSGSFVHGLVWNLTHLWIASAIAAIAANVAMNVVATSIAVSIRDGQTVRAILVGNVDRTFCVAYAYFGVAAILVSSLVATSYWGFLQGAVVVLLCVSMTRMLDAARGRRMAASQLLESSPHVTFSHSVAVLLHNLRNCISLIVEHLDEGTIMPSGISEVERQEVVRKSTRHALDLIESIERESDVAWSVSFGPNDLTELARFAVQLVGPALRARMINITTDSSHASVTVDCNELLVREVLTNLLMNASTHSPSGSTVRVSVGTDSKGAWVQVADSGPGMLTDDMTRILRGETRSPRIGHGLGLLASREMMIAHGGDLVYKSGDPGSVFTAWFPISVDTSSPSSS